MHADCRFARDNEQCCPFAAAAMVGNTDKCFAAAAAAAAVVCVQCRCWMTPLRLAPSMLA